MRRHSSEVKFMNLFIELREVSDLCASVPQHTASHLPAAFSISSVKGMLSHATPWFIVYVGTPWASSLTDTLPVGKFTRGVMNFNPLLFNASIVSPPKSHCQWH